jgi:hypothetical protein
MLAAHFFCAFKNSGYQNYWQFGGDFHDAMQQWLYFSKLFALYSHMFYCKKTGQEVLWISYST